MIEYKEHILSNGLGVITHHDPDSPLAVVNLMYRVGSKNESRDKTGFAHLFEHLMFGGSKHIPDFDKVLQKAGADNNAFTNTDITNYYVILGKENIETALWAESDRMKHLTLNKVALDNQKSVVTEEFKQRYLNVPYGDVMLHLRPLAYKVHPYQWPTIGKSPDHIAHATLKDVNNFHKKYYPPDNAILTIAGNYDSREVETLAEKWFGDIPSAEDAIDTVLPEPAQNAPRSMTTYANVPLNAIYKAFHMPGRSDDLYMEMDLISDLLGRGKSSRLYKNLVKEHHIFNSIDASITGTADPGLLIVAGKIAPGIDPVKANDLLEKEIMAIKSNLRSKEIQKVINQAISSSYFGETELLNRAIHLSVGCALGNTNLVNEEQTQLNHITIDSIMQAANTFLIPQNCSTLFYLSNK